MNNTPLNIAYGNSNNTNHITAMNRSASPSSLHANRIPALPTSRVSPYHVENRRRFTVNKQNTLRHAMNEHLQAPNHVQPYNFGNIQRAHTKRTLMNNVGTRKLNIGSKYKRANGTRKINLRRRR